MLQSILRHVEYRKGGETVGIAESVDQLNDTLKELVLEIREWKQMMSQEAQEK